MLKEVLIQPYRQIRGTCLRFSRPVGGLCRRFVHRFKSLRSLQLCSFEKRNRCYEVLESSLPDAISHPAGAASRSPRLLHPPPLEALQALPVRGRRHPLLDGVVIFGNGGWDVHREVLGNARGHLAVAHGRGPEEGRTGDVRMIYSGMIRFLKRSSRAWNGWG